MVQDGQVFSNGIRWPVIWKWKKMARYLVMEQDGQIFGNGTRWPDIWYQWNKMARYLVMEQDEVRNGQWPDILQLNKMK
jgi:hypothetical protein